MDGLALLDLLKRTPETRHIPVHVISAERPEGLGLSMGAFGFTHKPVERDGGGLDPAGREETSSTRPTGASCWWARKARRPRPCGSASPKWSWRPAWKTCSPGRRPNGPTA